MAQCDCGATIVFVKMQSGRPMPCDPEVVEVITRESGKRQRGDLVVISEDGFLHTGRPPAGDLFTAQEQGAIARGRVPHWSTCPNSAQYRKGVRT